MGTLKKDLREKMLTSGDDTPNRSIEQREDYYNLCCLKGNSQSQEGYILYSDHRGPGGIQSKDGKSDSG